MRGRVRRLSTQPKARGVKFGRPQTIHSRVDEIGKLKTQGTAVRAIARTLKMPVSSAHKALQLAA
jgi:hypothetical protein